MNKEQKILSDEQRTLLKTLIETYNLTPEDVVFFADESEPTLSFEAQCVLLNSLTDVQKIDLEAVPAISSDSVARRTTLKFPDGRERSAVGVANLSESLEGSTMSERQTDFLASSRSIRAATRTAGINLIKLHLETIGIPASPAKSNRTVLIAQIHKIANELAFITRSSREPYEVLLWKRYGVRSCNELGDDALADFAAYLNALVPQRAAA
jgi:hypothetical protein